MDSCGEILPIQRWLGASRLIHSTKPFVPASGVAQWFLVLTRKVSCRLMSVPSLFLDMSNTLSFMFTLEWIRNHTA